MSHEVVVKQKRVSSHKMLCKVPGREETLGNAGCYPRPLTCKSPASLPEGTPVLLHLVLSKAPGPHPEALGRAATH